MHTASLRASKSFPFGHLVLSLEPRSAQVSHADSIVQYCTDGHKFTRLLESSPTMDSMRSLAREEIDLNAASASRLLQAVVEMK